MKWRIHSEEYISSLIEKSYSITFEFLGPRGPSVLHTVNVSKINNSAMWLKASILLLKE